MAIKGSLPLTKLSSSHCTLPPEIKGMLRDILCLLSDKYAMSFPSVLDTVHGNCVVFLFNDYLYYIGMIGPRIEANLHRQFAVKGRYAR